MENIDECIAIFKEKKNIFQNKKYQKLIDRFNKCINSQ
jgi:hypothetical protein